MDKITQPTIGYTLTLGNHANFQEFINQWSAQYKYPLESKYNGNIARGLESKENLHELLKWKNGTGDNISGNKMKTVDSFILKLEVLKNLKQNFRWDAFEKEFAPQKSSSIWKIFLLHIINPNHFPIFDQHVYRTFIFITEGSIKELPHNKGGIKHRDVYTIYKELYLPWFTQIRENQNIEPKNIDEAFFSFGRVLKLLKDVPCKITGIN